MITRSLALSTTLTALAAPALAQAQPQATTEVFDRLREAVERARGLRFRRKVPSAVLTPAQYRAHLRRGDPAPPGTQSEPSGEELLWQALGLISRQTNVEQATQDDDASSTAGFYVQDPSSQFQRGSLVLVKRPGEDVTPVAAHELLHALHDQTFGLERLAERVPRTPQGEPRFDAQLAFESLEEGVSTYLGDAIGQQVTGQPPAASFSPFRERDWIGAKGQVPYSLGAKFAAALHARGGRAALDRAYAAPPVSSEQILHPERYLQGDVPSRIELPDFTRALPGRWERVYESELGEFGIAWLLGQRAGTGWDGDRLLLLREQRTGQTIVAWQTTWDRPEDATAFRLAAGRSKRLLRGLPKGQLLALEQRGREVFLATGLTERQVDPLLAASSQARVIKEPGDDDTWPTRRASRGPKSPLQSLLEETTQGRSLVRRGARPRESGRALSVPLTEAQRRALAPELEALRRAARTRGSGVRRIGKDHFALPGRRSLRFQGGLLALTQGRPPQPLVATDRDPSPRPGLIHQIPLQAR